MFIEGSIYFPCVLALFFCVKNIKSYINTTSVWTDHMSITQVIKSWKYWEKETAHDPKHATSSVNHGWGSVMVWACTAATGTGLLAFTDVLVDGSGRMNSDVYRIISSDPSKCLNLLDHKTHWAAGQWPQTSSQMIFSGRVEWSWLIKSTTLPESNIHFTWWRQHWRQKIPKQTQKWG